jgi:lactoylglutathione lyase
VAAIVLDIIGASLLVELIEMRFIYFGIRVRNLKRSLRFYTKVLGMRVVHKGKMAHGGIFVHLKHRGSPQRLELNYYPPRNRFHEKYKPGSEFDHLGFWSEDVDRTYAQLVSKGAKTAMKPFSDDGQRLTYIKDPDGMWIEIFGADKRKKKQ